MLGPTMNKSFSNVSGVNRNIDEKLSLSEKLISLSKLCCPCNRRCSTPKWGRSQYLFSDFRFDSLDLTTPTIITAKPAAIS